MQPSEYSLRISDAGSTDPDVEYGPERRGQQTSLTRETVEEMIAAALDRASLNPRTVVDSEAEQALLDQYQKKIACLEHQRDEDLVKIQNLKHDLEKNLHEVTLAKSKAVAARESDATVQIARKQDELDVVLAAMKVMEAKVAHLESQLAKIHSLSESDVIIASTSARPDDQAELASHKSLPQTEKHWTVDSEFYSQTQGTWTDIPQTEGDRNVACDYW